MVCSLLCLVLFRVFCVLLLFVGVCVCVCVFVPGSKLCGRRDAEGWPTREGDVLPILVFAEARPPSRDLPKRGELLSSPYQ